MSIVAAVDIETSDPFLKQFGPGSIRNKGHIIGIGVYCPELKMSDFYKPSDPRVIDLLKDETITKVFHNGVYDLDWIMNGSDHLEVNGRCEDTMTRETLLDSYAFSYSLDACCQRHNIEGKNKGQTIDEYWRQIGGKGKAVEHLDDIPFPVVAKYCIQDCKATYELFLAQQPMLEEQGLLNANDIEVRLYPLLMDMRKNGFRINIAELLNFGSQLQDEYDTAMRDLERIYGFAEGTLSLNSAKDLEKIWKQEKLPIEYTATGKPSFAAAVLDDCDHPIASQVKHLKGIIKTMSFLDGWMDMAVGDHLYPSFYPAKRDDGGTVTGRWSSQNPNLQQVPAREDKHGKEIRSLFIPEEGCYLGAFDYKQIEYRVFTHFAQGEGAVEAQKQFNRDPNTDYHQMTIDLMGWGDLGKEGRHLAKNLNFTCISPDSFIATKRGYIRARDLKNDDLLVLDSGKWRAFIGQKEQFRFTLSNGQQFCVTTNHPFKLFGKRVGASTLNVGDVWDVVPNRHWGDIQRSKVVYSYHKTIKEVEYEIDEKFAYMLGVWLGDGCLHTQYKTKEPSSLSFCTPPENTKYLQSMFSKVTTTRKTDAWEVWMYTDKALSQWVLENCGRTSTKHVPDIIYRSPRSVMVSFMRGFLDSDGTVYDNKPQLINTNESLMRGLARCCAMLGWKARWGSETYSSAGCAGTLYRLFISRDSLTYKELQGKVRTWEFEHGSYDNPVTIVGKEYIGERETFCIELPPPHWYEAECCINHNSIYGLGARSFAERFKHNLMHNHPERDPDNLLPVAQSLMNEYFYKVPFVKPTCKKIMEVGERRGYVKTLSGRRQRMPLDKGSYKLINYLIQGSAADLLKKGIVEAWEKGVFKILKLHAQVHDEIVFSIPKTKEGYDACKTLYDCMTNAYQLKIPLGVDTEIGKDWGHCDMDTWLSFEKEVQ